MTDPQDSGTTHAVLHADTVGTGPRLVALHGFTQTRRCWGPVATDLARDHTLVLADAPGHGRSPDGADLAEAARRLAAHGPGTYLGYSMGGRIVLRAALDHPATVRRVVLVGASPGLADPDERDRRRRADEDLARHIEEIGVPAFLDEWLALPLFAGLTAEAAGRTERLENTTAGLAASLRHAGTGAQEPLWARLGELRDQPRPVLLVTGGADAKFSAIAAEMAHAIGPAATHVVIPGAGHTAHLEDPAAFLVVLRAWLAAHPAA